LKCRYSYCKHDGEVLKDEAVKEGNCYYHKDCLEEKTIKQQIEEYYLANMPSTTLQILRKVVKQLVHEKNTPADYVLFVLKYININNKPINNPFGLVNYCSDYKLKNEYSHKNATNKYKDIKNNIINNIDDKEIKFTYNSDESKWLKIL
jgi:hypothetical protein